MKQKVIETTDINPNPNLVTRYYICTYDVAKNAVKKVAEQTGYTLAGENDDYSELLFVGGSFDFIVRISNYNPRETGIDFFVDKKSIFAFNGVKHVVQWYELLGKELQFKGLGLHKNG